MNNIFTNSDSVEENIKGSMENMGVKPPEKKNEGITLVPKKNCKLCIGKGFLKIWTPKNEKVIRYCKCVKVIRDV